MNYKKHFRILTKNNKKFKISKNKVTFYLNIIKHYLLNKIMVVIIIIKIIKLNNWINKCHQSTIIKMNWIRILKMHKICFKRFLQIQSTINWIKQLNNINNLYFICKINIKYWMIVLWSLMKIIFPITILILLFLKWWYCYYNSIKKTIRRLNHILKNWNQKLHKKAIFRIIIHLIYKIL